MASTQTDATRQAQLNGPPSQGQASEALKRETRQARRPKPKGQAAKRAQAKPETFTTQVAGVAEAVILVPVGATLEARDTVVGAITPWTTRTGAEKEFNRVRRDVRRYERRGDRAVRGLRQRYSRVLREVRKRRNQTRRVVKKNRTQAERAVRQNRRRVESEIRSRRERVEKAVRPQVTRVQRTVSAQTKEVRGRVSSSA